jgi:hypothetical protein
VAGRHSAPSRLRARPLVVVLAVVGVFVVLAGGGTAWAFTRGPLSQPRVVAITSASPTHTPVPAPILDCKESVQAGDVAVSKAYQSYKDWYVHVKAQWDLDKGKITVPQADHIWDVTHKRGSLDINAADASRIIYQRQRDACGKVPKNVPTKYTSAVGHCKTRAAVIDTTMTAGMKVGDEWADHVLKEHQKRSIDPYDYHLMWIKAVRKAPKALSAFKKAYDTYKKTPACQLPQSS